MTQARQAQPALQAPRLAIVALLILGTLVVGMVSGIALTGTPLLGRLFDDDREAGISPAVLTSGLEWERQREQQRMFGDSIPPGWFQAGE